MVLSAIKTAVEELVAERGSERVTIPMVAERAGVNPTSVYRRWGDASTMINDIATYRLDPGRPLPKGDDLRTLLTEWADEIIRHYSDPVHAAILRGGAASAGQSQSDCLRNRRAEAGMLVQQAAPVPGITVERVIDHIVAPIVYRVIFIPDSLDETLAPRLVAELFD